MGNKISIIVPCYNVAKFLPTCIESVQQQTYVNWELILVDDGSPDRCGEICDERAKKDDRIRVIHKPNGGLSDARNAGLDVVNGKYVTFLDSDDFWHPDYLSVMMRLVEKYNADMVMCSHIKGEDIYFPKISKIYDVNIYDNHSVFTKMVANITMWGKVFKTSFFDDIRMPVGLINEDDWTTWKLYYKASKIAVTTQSLYYYTINPNSIMNSNNKKLDLSYLGAYDERISFFAQRGEEDLECMSHLQLLKSCVLSYQNSMATDEQKKTIVAYFRKSWKVVRFSSYIKFYYKILFGIFSISPAFGSKLANIAR